MKNERSSQDSGTHVPYPFLKEVITLIALKKCKAVEEETVIELITPPIQQELNKGTAATYVGLVASTPETFELRITFLTQGDRSRFFSNYASKSQRQEHMGLRGACAINF